MLSECGKEESNEGVTMEGRGFRIQLLRSECWSPNQILKENLTGCLSMAELPISRDMSFNLSYARLESYFVLTLCFAPASQS